MACAIVCDCRTVKPAEVFCASVQWLMMMAIILIAIIFFKIWDEQRSLLVAPAICCYDIYVNYALVTVIERKKVHDTYM